MSKTSNFKAACFDVAGGIKSGFVGLQNDSAESELIRNLILGPVAAGVAYAIYRKYPSSKWTQPKISWKKLWIIEGVGTGLAITGYVLDKLADREDRKEFDQFQSQPEHVRAAAWAEASDEREAARLRAV